MDPGAASICDMLQKNTFLKRIYLSNNKFEEPAALHFRTALSHNETLEILDLGWNHFRTNGAVAIAEGVQVRPDFVYGCKCIVPQCFDLLPILLKSIVCVIRFFTNTKFAFFCIY